MENHNTSASPGADRRILYADPFDDPDEGTSMQFRLTFQGQLYSTQRDARNNQKIKPARRDYRHEVRQQFHRQLKELWAKTEHLELGKAPGLQVIGFAQDDTPPEMDRTAAGLAERHAMFGFNFVPLVTEDMGLHVGLDILFLHRDPPGSLFSDKGRDIDNRIKTLIDCLRLPDANDDYTSLAPAEDEKPFYCLLQTDKLVTKISVETDLLLQDIGGAHDDADALLVLTVNVTPYRMDWDNLPFVG